MRRYRVILLIAAVFATTLTITEQAASACVHPYPCGDEWPSGLEGPFALKEVQYVRVPVPADYDDPSKGTIELEGWIGIPDLPSGVGAPVALSSSPYNGHCAVDPLNIFGCPLSPADHSYWWADPPAKPLGAPGPNHSWGEGVTPIGLVKRGFAAAYFSVRGTGNSGGCFDLIGGTEQKDQRRIVDYVATQSWSNGRVAMGGLSYLSGTALEAAVTSPEADDHLKAIVLTGVLSDLYGLFATPQGAFRTVGPATIASRFGENTFLPPVTPLLSGPYSAIPISGEGRGGGFQEQNLQYFLEHLGVRAERACPGVRSTVAGPMKDQVTDDRDEAFYEERRLIDRAGGVTAAVLMAHGFLDRPFHGFQESALWNALTHAPKRQIEGPWGHQWPDGQLPLPAASFDPSWDNVIWADIVYAWLDYWLKGRGTPERLGVVDYQDNTGAWRDSDTWPPSESHEEVMYLTGDRLASAPSQSEPRWFRSSPNPGNAYHNMRYAETVSGVGVPYRPWAAVCTMPAAPEPAGLLYTGEVLSEPLVLAGDPFAYLTVTSDAPGGIITLNLLDIGPDFTCDSSGQPTAIRELTSGAADLRFHRGNFSGEDFPVGVPTPVRFDLFDLAETLPAGHRLGLVVSYGDGYAGWTSSSPHLPRITVHHDFDIGSSQLVLPIVEGTLGGIAPGIEYPPRPFVPRDDARAPAGSLGSEGGQP